MNGDVLTHYFDNLGGSPLLAWLGGSFLEENIQHFQLQREREITLNQYKSGIKK